MCGSVCSKLWEVEFVLKITLVFFIHSFIHSFIQLFIRSFIHSFIHSITFCSFHFLIYLQTHKHSHKTNQPFTSTNKKYKYLSSHKEEITVLFCYHGSICLHKQMAECRNYWSGKPLGGTTTKNQPIPFLSRWCDYRNVLKQQVRQKASVCSCYHGYCWKSQIIAIAKFLVKNLYCTSERNSGFELIWWSSSGGPGVSSAYQRIAYTVGSACFPSFSPITFDTSWPSPSLQNTCTTFDLIRSFAMVARLRYDFSKMAAAVRHCGRCRWQRLRIDWAPTGILSSSVPKILAPD